MVKNEFISFWSRYLYDNLPQNWQDPLLIALVLILSAMRAQRSALCSWWYHRFQLEVRDKFIGESHWQLIQGRIFNVNKSFIIRLLYSKHMALRILTTNAVIKDTCFIFVSLCRIVCGHHAWKWQRGRPTVIAIMPYSRCFRESTKLSLLTGKLVCIWLWWR